MGFCPATILFYLIILHIPHRYFTIIKSIDLQDWAIPLYGYAMPILVAVTAVTNSFIIIVLSQRHLRTPTNSVLLAMAIADLLTGMHTVKTPK